MTFAIRNCFVVVAFVIVSLGIAQGSPLDPLYNIQTTIDAIEDAGQYPGQPAYLKFVDADGNEFSITPAVVPSRWTSRDPVDQFATAHNIHGWHLKSGGNIWSSDNIVGDALAKLNAGTYRVSVKAGAFMYDSFDKGWSEYENQWRWELHIQALKAIQNGKTLDYLDFLLGSKDYYDSAGAALQASLGSYVDIPLDENGSLIFWIWDNPNTIDNWGSLTFSVTQIPPAVPEPATLILIGTGLFVLVRRFRGALVPLN